MTAIVGSFSAVFSSLRRVCRQVPAVMPEAAYIVTATAGATNASAICMRPHPFVSYDFTRRAARLQAPPGDISG